jgi:DNA-binding XRE family transcriptional regulator
MPKTPRKSKSPSPEWAKVIRELREELGLNQAELGLRLHYSAMAISRWERGEQEPPDRAYIELGNVAGNPRCWHFWGRAGLHSENLLRVMPKMRDRLQTSTVANLEIARAGSGAQKTPIQSSV